MGLDSFCEVCSGLEEIICAKNSLHTALDLTWDILFPRLIWYSAINYFLLRYTSVIQSLCSVLIECLWYSATVAFGPSWHPFDILFSWIIICSATNYFPLTITFVIQSLCTVLIEISGISLLLLLFMSLLLVLLKTVEFCCS